MPDFTTATTAPALVPDRILRLGAVVLATDLTIEGDLAALMPPGAALHISRIPYANPTTPENLRAMAPHLAAAVDLILPGLPLAALGFGCTSGGVMIGDAQVAATVASVRPGVPVCAPAQAAVQGLAHLGARRIAVLTPYVAQTTGPVLDYFTAAGLEVVRAHGLGMDDDRKIARLSPDAIIQAALQADDPQAQALFVSCTATPVLPLIPQIEALLGKPVLSSNQALGWAMLRAAGLSTQGPGRLFTAGVAAA